MDTSVDDASHDKRQILISATIGISISISTTLLRLFLRRGRLWYDDLFALLGLVSLLITAVGGKLYYALDDQSTTPQTSRVAFYYITTVTFNTTIWISRLSILYSIIRLGSYQRRLYAVAVCFTTVLVVLISQVFLVCEWQNRWTNWKEDVVPMCILGSSVAIAQITTDAFADIVLVTVPLLLLRYLESSAAKAQKVRLTASFVVGGLTTVVSAVHAGYLIKGGHESIVVSNVELSVSVIISNFAVIAAAVHRIWNKYYSVREPVDLPPIEFGREGGDSQWRCGEGTDSTNGGGSGTRSGVHNGVYQDKVEFSLFALRDLESGSRTDDGKAGKG